jgi:hypothetical protein
MLKWYEQFLIKKALGGSPISSMMNDPFRDEKMRRQGHQVSDYRLAQQLLKKLAPVYREVPLRRARARASVQEAFK